MPAPPFSHRVSFSRKITANTYLVFTELFMYSIAHSKPNELGTLLSSLFDKDKLLDLCKAHNDMIMIVFYFMKLL